MNQLLQQMQHMLDESTGELTSGKQLPTHTRHKQRLGSTGIYSASAEPSDDHLTETYGDTGGASRFFYVGKATKRDREEGNTHPTVKPIELMRWLCRLITPPLGTVLDCFMGSGSTGIAALEEKEYP